LHEPHPRFEHGLDVPRKAPFVEFGRHLQSKQREQLRWVQNRADVITNLDGRDERRPEIFPLLRRLLVLQRVDRNERDVVLAKELLDDNACASTRKMKEDD
jgi:hypothetical protein